MILKILDDRLLYCNPGRSLDFMRLNRYFQFMDHHPGVTEGRVNRFADFSGLERIDIDSATIQAIAEIRGVTTATHKPAKVVHYSNRPLGFDIARMFEAFFRSGKIQLRAMDDLDKALKWIGATDLKATIVGLEGEIP
jgi:hypothetical protein